jgi:hypothetical protein
MLPEGESTSDQVVPASAAASIITPYMTQKSGYVLLRRTGVADHGMRQRPASFPIMAGCRSAGSSISFR